MSVAVKSFQRGGRSAPTVRKEMTMIEKLVELMAKADEHRDEICVGHGCERCQYEQYSECGIQIKAEYLIANGVRLEEKQATSDGYL